MLNQLLRNLKTHPELIIVVLMVMIVSMFIIPLPTYLVDFLIGFNMTLALLIFMGAFYIERILSFSTFPTILLITTLFRLALSISTSRLILIDADAGDIINTFGQFVIGDSLIVGFVVFSIVTVVQFIVITKGSERVAEVAARFSLDGMPGKQMSIDADLRAGIIDADEAGKKRTVLEQESQLYGSFDGAMKFIKGDAIASIIIIFVNLIGGISVGVTHYNMDVSTALETYTMLTIGDGLVAQIPALLISISAGFIVTKVNGDQLSTGKNILNQLLDNPIVIIVTAVLTLSLGLLPGFPVIVFIMIASSLGVFLLLRYKKRNADHQDTQEGVSLADNIKADSINESESVNECSLGIIENLEYMFAETIPLLLNVSMGTEKIFQSLQIERRIASQFFVDYGVKLPTLVVRGSNNVENHIVELFFNEVLACRFIIHFDMMRILNFKPNMNEIFHINTVIEKDAQKKDIAWISKEDAEKIKPFGFHVRNAIDELYSSLSIYLVHNISEFFGIQETKQMMDRVEQKYPEVIKEVMRYMTIQRTCEILQRLLIERISVRNIKAIMEALAEWAPKEKDIINLTEHARGALSRYICQKFTFHGELKAIVLSVETEQIIRDNIRQTASGAFVNISPTEAENLLNKIEGQLSKIHFTFKDYVLITSVDIRRFVRKFIESRFPDLEVISFGEISDEINLNVLITI
ncbi:EscV/YscV/HrcV family type III secretion system export apparatus protein [Escherichia coli]|uniref:EscV/YscV/HrcV family type III secretion system export apparatus protein n=1 Tax=Escherichia coli TaxID=562 RepID=UPI001D957BE9|nr:EscV/YscV/HrcV family type III secretion system export apparatus protein [Escherichia coli]EHB0476463.1 EscV/YscV/HrcV family type III secretion system export apparatus protein [Escherichia coli]ELS5707683.1 EscV/YscV/HrcV family type III secretion system export apparatus protein [Escherichia coli]